MRKKIVSITGATSGIGEGRARKFASMEWNLILNGRNTDKLEMRKKELSVKGKKP